MCRDAPITAQANCDPDDMIVVAVGAFAMGCDRFFPEEAPVRRVKFDTFPIDPTPVTNAQFAAFVAPTGHVTLAEIAPDAADYPGMSVPVVAGTAVFEITHRSSNTAVPSWWKFRPWCELEEADRAGQFDRRD